MVTRSGSRNNQKSTAESEPDKQAQVPNTGNCNISYDDAILERFIPITVEDLIEDLIATDDFTGADDVTFEKICRMFVALYHANFHSHILDLKRNYLPFSPDRDTLITRELSAQDNERALQDLLSSVKGILNQANFERLSVQALTENLNKNSPYGVAVSVDFNDFDEMEIYYRGSAIHSVTMRDWRKLYLKKITYEVPLYRRLFVLLKPSEKARQNSTLHEINTSCVYLKLFKDIPQYDLEMLFPNTKVKMSLFDKVKLSITGGGGTVSGLLAFLSKASLIAANPISFLVALGGLIAVLWRQVANVLSHRTKYMALLTKNLYFYNLNNNLGAITQVTDMAESEECKEAILVYYFLAAHPEQDYDRKALDEKIEAYLQDTYQCICDFEIEDGVNKLKQWGLLTESNNILRVMSLNETLASLNQAWDDLYSPD